ncbi:MAG: hypothetical protein CMJ36_03140 [Phycisphaerae bacterium]|nr:hypothetical protein [Phycisphaerae bacterium]
MAPRKKKTEQPDELMIVNDVPGEECRIAIVQDGHLEELYAERVAAASNVGNIYKGRVTNVESAIQAAFVDFGHAQRGFLHISDLHPQYFPGGDKTEKVGRKTTRRDRPPIQNCLKRGQEILVQVLKEGIGTKGPTLTSYLSIPGRLMVMMPNMDRVGVSRKVEDDDQRKIMRDVLDKLDLPDDFGFILRTAGIGRTKLELKRDVAYLTRLWKVMKKRQDTVGAPCELYTESDLFIRTIRDVLRPSIKAIVVDSDSAYQRCMAFLRVIAPRSAPEIIQYRRSLPLFHAFDVERQIDSIHQREVTLPSGGRLVIDQTEALVAIDVNSGRSRSAKDSETNAFQTNMEAADEICRQLRLRDLGGLIIHDLIDMRMQRHRRTVEERFAENLERDRARTTILKISEFGILEMTRQRMRPSMRMSHFISCQSCDGQGEIKSPDSVGTDVLRNVGYLLQHDQVARVEVVVSPKVASVLLSTRRHHLNSMEDQLQKQVDVRVSETIAADRVSFYAYDESNTDLELSSLKKPTLPSIKELSDEAASWTGEEIQAEESDDEDEGGRRRRRRRKAPPADAAAIALSGELMKELDELEEEADQDDDEIVVEAEEAPRSSKKRRRSRGGRGRRGRGRKPVVEPPIEAAARLYILAKKLNSSSKEILEKITAADAAEVEGWSIKNHMSTVTPEQAMVIAGWLAPPAEAEQEGSEEETPKRGGRRRRRRRRRSGGDGESSGEAKEQSDTGEDKDEDEPAPRKKRRSRRGSRGGRGRRKKSGGEGDDGQPEAEASEGKKKKRGRRGGRGRKKKTTTTGSSDSAETKSPESTSEPKPKPEPKPKRRTLYGGSRRGVSKSEIDKAHAGDGVA